MMRHLAPYQKVAFVSYLLVPLYVVLNYYLLPGRLPVWLETVAWVLAGYLVVAFVIETYFLVRDYRAGQLFPVRNATFFVTLFSLVAIPLLGMVYWQQGEYYGAPTLLLIPVFLYYCISNLHYVRIDRVSLRAKTGIRAPVAVPLFGIRRVEEGADEVVLEAEGAVPIRLLRGYFFPGDWQRLRQRLRELQN